MLKKKSSIATSYIEAKHMAMSPTSCKSSWLEILSNNLRMIVNKSITINCNNEASIKMA